MDIKVGRYSNPGEVGYQGWIEPSSGEWILFIPTEGRPELFEGRDEEGGVLQEHPTNIGDASTVMVS